MAKYHWQEYVYQKSFDNMVCHKIITFKLFYLNKKYTCWVYVWLIISSLVFFLFMLINNFVGF